MSLFILFCIQFFDRIFEDILFVSSGINWLISDVCRPIYIPIYGMTFVVEVFSIIFFKDRIPISIFQ